jgi:hypothetical protein
MRNFSFFLLFLIHPEIIICTIRNATLKEPEISIIKENWFLFYQEMLDWRHSSIELSEAQTQFAEFARGFLKRSPKECLQYIRDARDGLFTAFTFTFLADYFLNTSIFSDKKMPYTEKIRNLTPKFGEHCQQVLKLFWRLPFKKDDQIGFDERIETFKIFLEIQRQFYSYPVKVETQKPHSYYETSKFILKEFEFTADFVPSYIGLLKTFDLLCSLSCAHRGVWQNLRNAQNAYNLINLFQHYSAHFYKHEFENLPENVPALLRFLIIEQSWYNIKFLFKAFSFKSLSKLWFYPLGPISPMLSKVFPLFAAQAVKNKAIGFEDGFDELKMSYFNILKPAELYSLPGFASFLTSLNDFGPEYFAELKKRAKIDLCLTKREQFFLTSYVKLYRTREAAMNRV